MKTPGQSVPVLMYHAIDPQSSVVSVDPARFSQQMSWLYRSGYKTLTQKDLADCLYNKRAFPPKSVVLTFDDGYQSIYSQAFPILAKYGFTATIFLVAGYCGAMNDWPDQPIEIPRWPILNWQQIQEMDRAGIAFGAHGMSHAQLDVLEPDNMHQEIRESKTLIEEQLDHKIFDFAYPYGKYNSTIKEYVRQFFASACSTRNGQVTAASDSYEIERIEIAYLNNLMIFQGLSQEWFPLYLAVRSKFRKLGGVLFHRKWD